MFRSKALKGFDDEDLDKKKSWLKRLDLWWYESWLGKKWYHYKWELIEKPISHFRKVWAWYWNVFRNDYDFDAHCLFAIIEYKLKRVLPQLEKGHAIQEDKDMKALKLAIKLAGRLKEDKYDEAAWDRHEKKWGKLKTWFTDCEDKPGYSQWNSSRPKATTPEEKEQERKDHLEGMYAADKRMKREERWLYDILRNHLRVWWD